MSIKVLHQCGHNSNWNLDSFIEDNCGDGLILSPVHQNKSKIESMSTKLKVNSIFDPQFYLPNSQKKKLNSYPFFPECISDGFSTSDFSLVALEAAKRCIDFQATEEFEKIIISARFFEQMVPDFTQKQDIYTVHPFLKAYDELGINQPIYLTVSITAHMVGNETYRNMILNWVTSFPEIVGVYLIVASDSESKQIQSDSFLINYLEFLVSLKNADLKLIVGYANTESLLLCLVDDITVTMGSFENTRMFSIDKFVENDDVRRGPTARIYLPGLFNWVQYNQAKNIREFEPGLWKKIYQATSYGDHSLSLTKEPTFNQPPLYKHHFICMDQQIKKLSSISVIKRYNYLRDSVCRQTNVEQS